MTIPALKKDVYKAHQIIGLLDGTFVPAPAFGAGTALFGKNDPSTTQFVSEALKTGYRHLDNAFVYGNQKSVGEAIQKSGIPREDLYITSKFWHFWEEADVAQDGSDLDKQFQDSLKSLGVEYLDLFLIHHPVGFDIKLYWKKLEAWKEKGLVRSIGVSNFQKHQLEEVLSVAKYPPVVNQIEYHPYDLVKKDVDVEFAAKNKIVTAAYSALTPITKKPGGPVDPVINEIASELKITPAQVILAWVKAKGILDVTTSRNAERQKEQLAVFDESFPALSSKQVAAIDEAGKRLLLVVYPNVYL